MKGLKCISKLSLSLFSLFLVLFFSVLLSPKASAIDLSLSVKQGRVFRPNYNLGVSSRRTNYECSFSLQSSSLFDLTSDTIANTTPCVSGNYWISSLSSVDSLDFKEGNYYSFYILTTDGATLLSSPHSDFFQLINFRELSFDTSTLEGLGLIYANTSGGNTNSQIDFDYFSSHLYEFTLYADVSSSQPLSFTGLFTGDFKFLSVSYIYEYIPLSDSEILEEIKDNQDSAAEKEAQQEQDLQDGQSNAEDGADNASSAAQSGTDSLLGGLNTIFSALGSVSGSSCVLPDFSIYGLEFTNMDLCSLSVPPAILTITSVGMILGVGFLGYHLFHRIMNLYKELVG